MPEFVQKTDVGPEFWQFLRGVRHDDLIIELIQNELDANSSHTNISFLPGCLICTGDGEYIDENGWKRLSFIRGAGDQVEAKRFKIGVKNHGLKACFRIGDQIVLKSNRQKTVQTLYKDGRSTHPSPGAWAMPEWDEEAPLRGCSVEVPYRKKKLKVTKGEPLELSPVTDSLIENLFKEACEQLPIRLMGIVRPRAHSIRSTYTLTLSHHQLGSVEMRWEAKRGQTRGNGKRSLVLFSRECRVTSSVEGLSSSTVREQACTFKVSYPSAARREIPAFFMPEKQSFVGEVAWRIGTGDKPEAVRGIRRYPIGYESASHSQAALSGVGVHFSGPYASDSERHGASESEWNDLIDNACKNALVDVMASYLLPRYGGKAMELYLSEQTGSEILKDLVDRTINNRALPLQPSARRQNLQPGEQVISRRLGTPSRRVVLPMFTWDEEHISPLLADICPTQEDQIDSQIPTQILKILAGYGSGNMPSENLALNLITFNECDAIERLQPQSEAEYFPWRDVKDWRSTLANPSIASKYLDVVLEANQRGKLASEEEVARNAYLPDSQSTVRPLAEMYSAVSLPPNLERQDSIPLLHPSLKGHALFKRTPWKPLQFKLDDYLNKVQLEQATSEDRRTFWRWIRGNQKELTRSRALRRIADLPVWPSTNLSFVTLGELCEPANKRVAAAMGNTIQRPSPEILKSGLVKVAGRGRLAIRNIPTEAEVKHFLSSRLQRFSREESLASKERLEFQKFESDMTLLASVRQIRKALVGLSDEYAVALASDGYLKKPEDLVRNHGQIVRLHLLKQHLIDRSHKKLDQLSGWAPRQSPASNQIVETLTEDSARIDAHVPRFQEYLEQSKREGIEPDGLTEVSCIPVNGELLSPNELVFRGRPDYWGEWKTVLPVTTVNPDTQKIYERIGVIGRVPTFIDSLHFFQWLVGQSSTVIASHMAQILRHIAHKQGPMAWCETYPHIPFIPVEHRPNEYELVTKGEATRPRSNIAIPDFRLLEEIIKVQNGEYRARLAIVRVPQVEHPINHELRSLGLQTLRDLAKEPIRVSVKGQIVTHPEFVQKLSSLKTGLAGKQLTKRLVEIGLNLNENKVRPNWREHLSQIADVQTADSIEVVYRLFRTEFSLTTTGALDKQSGVLYLDSTSDVHNVFFENIANAIFEIPKQFLGGVLRQALEQDMREHDIVRLQSVGAPDSSDEEESSSQGQTEELTAAGGRHSLTNNPARNQPRPGPIPFGSASRSSEGKASSASSRRPASPRETAQINDLKENQYAWHCQACLAKWAPTVLTPPQSYAEHQQNRRGIMEAHHCDQVNAGGADHAGNLLLLCHYHHLDIGDAISRLEVTKSLPQAKNRAVSFPSANGATRIQGKIVTVRPPQRKSAIRLFFTIQHGDYWLEKAREENIT